MNETSRTYPWVLEAILVLSSLALACLLYKMTGYKSVVLNLFFLLVVLAGFFLGRYRAGVLALFCMLSAVAATAMDFDNFAVVNSPMVVALVLIVWGAVLGLTALLVGTLSDQRNTKVRELHDAYVGMVEVLSSYLQSANPRRKSRSARVAECSQALAKQLGLTDNHVDDIRVAALLHDMDDIEVTARVLNRAIEDVGPESRTGGDFTFHGADLVHSLGPVLRGAFPLLLSQVDWERSLSDSPDDRSPELPLGAEIIRVARAYDNLREGYGGRTPLSAPQALKTLREDGEPGYNLLVLDALEHLVREAELGRGEQPAPPPVAEPVS